MSSTIGITWGSDLYTDLKDELGESTADDATLIRITNRVVREMSSEIDMPSLIDKATLWACGEDAEKYLIPTAMKSQALIRVAPANGVVSSHIRLLSSYRYSKYNTGEFITIEQGTSKEYFKLLHSEFSGQSVIFTACETSLTADGTWTAGTGASNITHDSYDYKKGAGAINFDVDAANTAQISFVKSSAIDISNFTGQQRVRLFIKTPTAPTSIRVIWGSDSSNYYYHTLTTQVSGEAFSTSEWNELEANKDSATQVLTPDDENIDYFSIAMSFDEATAVTDYLIDHITFIQPEEMVIEFYSKNIARTAAGVYSEGLTETAATTDLLNIYEEHRQVIIDGVCARYLKMRGDKQVKLDAREYKLNYENGKQNIRIYYPSRRMHYQRVRELPMLSY